MTGVGFIMNQESNLESVEREHKDLSLKRLGTLRGVNSFLKDTCVIARDTDLNLGQMVEAVEDYLCERQLIKQKYNIKGRIAKHKVAGLMAAAIMKHRLIDHFGVDQNSLEIGRDNAEFAFWHSLAICAEGSTPEAVDGLVKLPNFGTWREDMLFCLRRCDVSGECLSMIFEVLSLTVFPDNFNGADSGD